MAFSQDLKKQFRPLFGKGNVTKFVQNEQFINSLLLGFVWGGAYALIASGCTLLWATTRQINIAHGEFFSIGIYICFGLAVGMGLEPYISILISAPVLVGLGLLFWKYMLRPVLQSSPLIFFQIGVGLVLLNQRILEIIFTPDVQAVPSSIKMNRVFIGPMAMETGYMIALVVSVVVCVGFYMVLQRTDFGRSIRAVAHCPDTASLMGINVSQVRFRTLSLAFVFVAIAAAVLAPMWSLRPSMGLHVTLMALIIMVVGGMGHLGGTLVVAFIIGLTQGLGQFYLGGSYSLAIPYAIFILVLLVRPQGLFGGRSLE